MKRILTILVCLVLIMSNIEFQNVQAVEATGYNNLNNGYIQFNSNYSDFTTMPITSVGPAINDYGNLNNPYYFDGTVWRPLTLSRKMEYALAEGGTLVSETDPYNVTGAGVYVYPASSSLSLSNFTVDGTGIVMSEQTTTAGNVTYSGTLVSKGEVVVNGKNFELKNTYTLLEGKSFIKVKTRVTNLSTQDATNFRYWVGTGDDWISTNDVNYKYRGNIIDGAFVISANSSVQSKAIRVDSQSHNDSILFYSTHPSVNTSVSGCCDFANAVNVNPLSSVVDTINDGSYALFVNLGSIAAGAYQEFDWYYAAGSAATILDTINDVSVDSAGTSNVTPTSATVSYTSETTTTGYYIVVPRGSSTPTANQIIGDEEYTSATIVKRGNSVMEAGVETLFDIDELAPGTDYDLYFVTRNSENVTSGISLTRFSTQANAVISLLSITSIDVPKNHRVPDIESIETDEYMATVSWSPDDVNFNNDVVYTATITISPKVGYTLIGVGANAFTVSGASATNSVNDGIITAVYPAVPLDFVNFDANGGSSVSSVAYDYDAIISEPTEVSRQGYEFSGWYEDDSTFANPWDFSTEKMPSSDLNLFAKWTALDQTTTFKANGGIGEDVTQVAKTDSTTLLTANSFYRSGYSFSGWSLTSTALTATYTDSQSITWFNSNTNLYAIWNANDQVITFNANGGVGSNTTQSAKTDSNTALTSNPFIREGYTFIGWALSTTATEAYYTNNQTITWVNSNTYLYAVWAADDHTVIFNANGGVGENTTQTAKSDSDTALNVNPFTKVGYTFMGWSLNPDDEEETYLDQHEIAWFRTDVTLYAIWDANDQTVSYKANGGIGEDVNQVAKTDSTTLLTANSFYRTGYSFSGWSITSTALTAMYTDSQSITWFNSNTNLYAIWNANDQVITFNANGGVGSDTTQSAKTDSSTSLNTNTFTRDGYLFMGWALSSTATEADYANSQTITWFNSNTYLYAVWVANVHTVTFNANGGIGEDTTQTANSDSDTALNVNPFTRVGYTFMGWSLNPDDEEETYLDQHEIAWFRTDVTLYAIWEINHYAVEFVENGGTTIGDQSVIYLTSATVPNVPYRLGYTFAGWAKENESSFYDFSTPIVNDITLFARWNPIVYRINYALEGGRTNLVTAYTIRDTIQLTTPIRPGYIFNGWYIGDEPISVIFEGTTGDLTLVGRWIFAPKDPVLDTLTVTNVLIDSAEIQANVLDYGNPKVNNFGYELENLDTGVITEGELDASLNTVLSNLASYTNYRVRVYANIGTKIFYTNEVTFKTQLLDTDSDGVPDDRDTDPNDVNELISYSDVSYDDPSELVLTGVLDETSESYTLKINPIDLVGLEGSDTIKVIMGNVEYIIPVALVDELFSDRNDSSYLELVVNKDQKDSNSYSILDTVNMDLVKVYDYSLFLIHSNGDSEPIYSFSGKIKVSVNLDDIDSDNDPEDMEIYYYDESTNTIVSMESTYNPDDNSLEFFTDHFSYYLLSVKSTNDTSLIWYALIAFIALGLGLILLIKRKSKE